MSKELKNLKIDPSDIKNRVNSILNADLREGRMYMKYKARKIAAIAASLVIISAASAFAITPVGQAAIENIISYFQDNRAIEISSYEELEKYNDEIGTSASGFGYTLTLDNVAADDNFIHVFCTVTSDEMPFYEDGNPEKLLENARNLYEECKINGQNADVNNHNYYEGYFVDDRTYKCVNKYNVSSMDIPDNFKLDFSIKLDLKASGYSGENKITVSADIDKSKIKVNTVTKNIDMPLWNDNDVIEKVIFSPFGNQIVIKALGSDEDILTSSFALFDENGTSLDILNTDLVGFSNGISRNSFEFLKADINTKQLKFVPVACEPVHEDPEYITQKIGSYPLVFDVSDNGKVVVTDIRISDSLIEIDYHYDGFVMPDAEFYILDDNGNNVCPSDSRVLYSIDINHKNSSYTAKYQYYYYDENDRMISAPNASASALAQQFTTLSLSRDFVKLDYDNAITVDIK